MFPYHYLFYFRIDPGTSSADEPKFIVFFSKLLALFSLFCFKCKESKPKVTMTQRGTMVIVKQHCQGCGRNPYTWKSQPMMFGRYPAGNVLLSFSVLIPGASISKILLVFIAQDIFLSPEEFLVSCCSTLMGALPSRSNCKNQESKGCCMEW